jgi:protein TonB
MSASYLSANGQDRFTRISAVIVAHALLISALATAERSIPVLKQPKPITVTLVDSKPPSPEPIKLRPVESAPLLPAPPQLVLPITVDTPPVAVAAATPVNVAAPTPVAVATPTLPSIPSPAAVPADMPPTADASAEGNAKPVYPKASRALGEQGRVLLDVYVRADGSVGEIRLHQTSGFDRLDDAALKAVHQWHYRPARQAGKEIAMWYVQPISFDLRAA